MLSYRSHFVDEGARTQSLILQVCSVQSSVVNPKPYCVALGVAGPAKWRMHGIAHLGRPRFSHGLQQGMVLPVQDTWQCLETFLAITV